MQNDADVVEDNLVISYKAKCSLKHLCDSETILLEIYPNELETCIHTKYAHKHLQLLYSQLSEVRSNHAAAAEVNGSTVV